MDHVHFDLSQVEKNMRHLYEQTLQERIAAAATAGEAAGYQAQGRFNEAQITCQIEMIRLLNEGHDAKFIGKTIGSFIGNLMINTLAASRNPELCLFHINRVTQNSLAVLTGETNAGVEFSQTKITGSRGGRA